MKAGLQDETKILSLNYHLQFIMYNSSAKQLHTCSNICINLDLCHLKCPSQSVFFGTNSSTGNRSLAAEWFNSFCLPIANFVRLLFRAFSVQRLVFKHFTVQQLQLLDTAVTRSVRVELWIPQYVERCHICGESLWTAHSKQNFFFRIIQWCTPVNRRAPSFHQHNAKKKNWGLSNISKSRSKDFLILCVKHKCKPYFQA